MAFSVSHDSLRNSHPQHAGPYLHQTAAQQQVATATISREIMQAVAVESMPPRVYALWLSACPDENAIAMGLQQPESVNVRSAAIKAFRRWFRTRRYQQIWHAVGGVEGIVKLLATFSVDHVRMFCKNVAKCSTSQFDRKERQELVTKLCQTLTSRFFPGSTESQNPDRRPLLDNYAFLVYGCTPTFQDLWLDTKGMPKLDLSRLLGSNPDWYRQKCLRKAAAGDDDLWEYSDLLTSVPSRPWTEDATVLEPIAFAAEIIETLVQHNVRFTKTQKQLENTLKIVIQRAARRRTSKSFTLRLIGLMSQYAMQNAAHETRSMVSRSSLTTATGVNNLSSSFTTLDLSYPDFLNDIATLWVRDPEVLEPLLSNVFCTPKTADPTAIIDALRVVKLHHRYRLFKWLIAGKHDLDVENDDHLVSLKPPVSSMLTLFRMLPKAVSRDLLKRFSLVRHSSIPNGDADGLDTLFDPLNIYLQEDDDSRLSEATDKIAIYRRKSEQSRDAYRRLNLVRQSVIMAVESCSLDLLGETLTWIQRRYLRDPVVTEFYFNNTPLRNDDTIRLLSGLAQKPSNEMPLSRLEADIRKGNDIALLLLGTATIAQREPSFYVNHWTQVQRLFVDIVQYRLNRIELFRASLSLSNDQIYALIWEPTLGALLKAEKLGLDEKNQKLQFNEIGGPLATWGSFEIHARNPSAATLRFIDEYAAQRNALWRAHRLSVHASVSTLQAPWPQGLPVQALLAIDIQGELNEGALPYLEERIRNVIFVAPEDAQKAIPDDEETRAAIGCFVDEYSEALKLYLSWCGKKEKEERSNAAWKYATTSLSGDRLSPLESRQYWEAIFTEAGASRSVFDSTTYPERRAPNLPWTNDSEQLQEWNPASNLQHWEITPRDLPPTCLDCLMDHNYGEHLDTEFKVPKPCIVPILLSEFWALSRFGPMVPLEAEEALIAAGLLLMDSRSKANSKILSTVFPTATDDIRFPALFLDAEFLEQKNESDSLLPRLLGNTPPALLEQLVSSLMSDLCAASDPSASLVWWAFTVLVLLAWSDKPGLAIKYIVRAVIDLPEHSSWHRVLLHPGVLKRLTVEQCKAMVVELGNAISENTKQRVETQAAAQQASTEEQFTDQSRRAENKPNNFVKVTTVKLLAQLMSGGEFCGEMVSVDVLSQLFKESTHLDIRAAVMDSLTSVLLRTKDASVEEAALQLLEICAIPVAASLSERFLMTEEQWNECEEKGELPQEDSDSPIKSSMMLYIQRVGDDNNHDKKRKLVQRLYLPLIKQSMENKLRWVKMFLRANGAGDLTPRLPLAFGSHRLLLEFLESHSRHMPANLFRELHKLFLFLLDLPKAVRGFNERLESVKPLPSGRVAWLKYTVAPLGFTHCVGMSINGNSTTPQDAASNDIVGPAQVQALARDMIDAVLGGYGEHISHWKNFTSAYNPPVRQTKPAIRLNWQLYGKPVVLHALERLESMCTTDWQKDPHRRPSRLPDSFQLRLWLLTYPELPWEGHSGEGGRRETFVHEVHGLIDELAASHRPYHARFEQVARAVKQCYEQEWAWLAWQLGKLDEEQMHRELTTAELLRVELADTLLQGARGDVKAEVLHGVRTTLRQWRQCWDEDARDRGIETTSSLARKAKRSSGDALPLYDEETTQ